MNVDKVSFRAFVEALLRRLEQAQIEGNRAEAIRLLRLLADEANQTADRLE